MTSVDSKKSHFQNIKNAERRVTIKLLVITGFAIVCWTPLMIVMVVTMASRTVLPAWVEIAAYFCVSFQAIGNPVLIFVFDVRLNGLMKGWLTKLGLLKESPAV